MKRVVMLTAGALALVTIPSFSPLQGGGGGGFSLSPGGAARAEESWKREFEEVCGKTDDSMNLSKDELKGLMTRCDKLKPVIEAQEETTRKVYLKRLRMCRDLLAYVYEAKSRN